MENTNTTLTPKPLKPSFKGLLFCEVYAAFRRMCFSQPSLKDHKVRGAHMEGSSADRVVTEETKFFLGNRGDYVSFRIEDADFGRHTVVSVAIPYGSGATAGDLMAFLKDATAQTFDATIEIEAAKPGYGNVSASSSVEDPEDGDEESYEDDDDDESV